MKDKKKLNVSFYQKRKGIDFKIGQWKGRLGWQHIPLCILYLVVIRWCIDTAGQPYQAALEEYEAKEKNTTVSTETGPSVVRKSDSVDFSSDAFDNWEPIEDNWNIETPILENNITENLDEDEANNTAASWDDGFEEDEGPALPSPFLPNFWAVFVLFVTGMLHILLTLTQHWSINFKTFIQYRKVSKPSSGVYAKVIPADPHSPAEIVQVWESEQYKYKEHRVLWLVSHKRKYEILGEDICKIPMPKSLPIQSYLESKGYTHNRDIIASEERFGLNKFDIPLPTFIDLYTKQLLSPLSVFQVFCVGLWLLDSAWKYAIFGLFSVLGFEATSVFTRLKNITMIRGMGNTPRDIFIFRLGKWIKTTTENILPGDLVSVQRENTSSGDAVPCDCLLLSGSAIMNEASLTGESVPQMKEAIGNDRSSSDRELNMKGTDKMHVLFGGTTMLQLGSQTERQSHNGIETPDGGCLCYVLRTGFSSSQGKLVRMIEFSSSGSTSSNRDFMRESIMMILLLLVFAIIASSYVLREGFKAGDRTKYDLLLHCILIVTSVVPPDLPMQLALAVNASLIHLVRQNIFCTEPFRVPLAGKIDTCFFDKTGTITTDQLEATGIIPASPQNASNEDLSAIPKMIPMETAPVESCHVIAGCHSLLQIEGKTIGDPIESAALKSIGWKFDQELQMSSPKENANEQGGTPKSIRIFHRFHFSSKLQRMSAISLLKDGRDSYKPFVFSKGSPEMIGTLLAPGTKPSWYDVTYQQLARKGMRVIALAYRPLVTFANGSKIDNAFDDQLKKESREDIERDLIFAGFVAFRCLMRKDSKIVVELLLKSNHNVVMITGDNVLTALHVACEVGLTSENREKILMLEKVASDQPLQWINAATEAAVCDFDISKTHALAKDYDLCISGKVLQEAFAKYGDSLGDVLHLFKVFARMAPDGKERVISLLNNRKQTTLMCGDGANDVGALRQAHVGVALLSGFGSLNADKSNSDVLEGTNSDNKEEEKVQKENESLSDENLGFFDRMKKKMEEAQIQAAKMQEERKKKTEEMKKNREKHAKDARERKQKMMREVEEETARLTANGESYAAFKAMKNVMQKHSQENKKKVSDAGGSFAFSAAALAAKEDGGLDDGQLPMLKLGDASTAAPFTSKFPSIRSVYDIIRQGRCTLVTSVQNNQIMCLTSLISSYSLSVLYLDGIKFSDYQMTATGMLLTASHVAVSHASPLKEISAVRPLTSMFNPALFFSLFGQFAIHLACMIIAVQHARVYIDPDFKQEMTGKFAPSLINTVVFFVETVQQVSVLMVNYKGRPFQPGLDENKPLLHSLGISCILLFICAYEAFPALNSLLELVPFPSDSLRWTVIFVLAFDVLGALLWDRLMHAIFARDLFIASQSQVDLFTFLRGCMKVGASAISLYVLVWHGSGIFGLMFVYFLYRNGFF